MEDMLLMTPGPTMVPEEVKKIAGMQPLHHRTEEFYQLFSRLNENLKKIFQTKNEVITLTSSGTGGMEAAVANLFSAGDKVLVASIGYFGERFYDIAKAYGLEAEIYDFGWGNAVDLDILEDKLKKGNYKALLVTHNETSTGVTNDIENIAKIANQYNIPVIVDAVSSLGGIPLKMDEWGIDAVITCSQKCLMSPPGLSFIALSDRAWEMTKTSNLPKYYFDLRKAREGVLKPKPDTPATPAVSTIMAVAKATDMLLEKGLDNVYKKQSEYGKKVRKYVKELGLDLLPSEEVASDLITAIKVPERYKASDIINYMKEKHRVLITGGQGPLKGKIIRIGHMGYLTDEMLDKALYALKDAISSL
ncbi:pyridoxal-phosphate-dependent aminotransferase family protein [Caldanaerobacter subterraneus]|uniref:Alanine--glyoxylate aminotransferase family protein n=1 Tax=Caldanaerobacter subterraneus TaxID=911092 RepID=A0A7Y2PK33_9THEO|nr:alanine--glyoxylate aminotransferase family protein [Caldanaerobacter subterraneus]NNG65706.1 alanine--glyoxylate aminotransferase family protein [Caldanaerobacter subterraneus]